MAGNERSWYAVYRETTRSEDGKEVWQKWHIRTMIKAYTDLDEARDHFKVWTEWDRVRDEHWYLVRIPRSADPDRDIDYHDVLEDLRALDVKGMEPEILERLTVADL